MTYYIGHASWYPRGISINPFNYKTDVFTGTGLADVYAYFKTNPSIYVLYADSISNNWGDELTGPVVGYVQTDLKWMPTGIPDNLIKIRWNISECDSKGNNPIPVYDIVTPLLG